MQGAIRLLFAWIFIFSYLNGISQACECGRASSSRIYDGKEVSRSDFPWMARLYSLKGNLLSQCGASMISSRYAVTAGHCDPQSSRARSYLVFGSTSISRILYSQYPNVEKFITKSSGRRGQDIALVRTTRDINVPFICLPPLDKSFAGVKATILGYGETEDGDTSTALLAGNVKVPSNAQCGILQDVSSREICGGNHGGGPAFCNGDSGGPMMYHDDKTNRWILIGVVSGSFSCSDTQYYGILTRVSSWVPWIQENSKDAGCQV